MSELTARHGMPLLVAGQGQKDVTHNEALLCLDALAVPVAESADLAEPPVSRVEGQCWLVADGAVGEWLGKSGKFALWTAGGWRFLNLPEGGSVYVKSNGRLMRKLQGQWATERWTGVVGSAIPLPSGGAVADVQARAAIASLIQQLATAGLLAS